MVYKYTSIGVIAKAYTHAEFRKKMMQELRPISMGSVIAQLPRVPHHVDTRMT